jgi:hypothetical protein
MQYQVLERFQSDRKIYEAGSEVDFSDDAAAVFLADGLIEAIASDVESKLEKGKPDGKGKPGDKPTKDLGSE